MMNIASRDPKLRRVLVTTIPFGVVDPAPLRLLEGAGVEVVMNPLGRRLRPEEIARTIKEFSVVIAGTETYPESVLEECSELKAICRVGIGLDGVPLLACRKKGVAVSYTPDGPSPAVAELTVGLIVDLLRGVGRADRGLRAGQWTRISGRRISNCAIGIIGVGRIGKRVIRHLAGGFPGVKILAHDINPDAEARGLPVEWTDPVRLIVESDIVSLHVPLSPATRNMVGANEFARMKKDSILINTARGGIVNESALYDALKSGRILAAAVDVFEEEPYAGPLRFLDNIIMTCHMGSMTEDCRARMEIEATEEAIRFLDGKPFKTPVPEEEYANAALAR